MDIITKHGELDENMLGTIWNTIIQNWASWDHLFVALFVTIFLGPRVRDTLDEGPKRRVNEMKQSICMCNKK